MTHSRPRCCYYKFSVPGIVPVRIEMLHKRSDTADGIPRLSAFNNLEKNKRLLNHLHLKKLQISKKKSKCIMYKSLFFSQIKLFLRFPLTLVAEIASFNSCVICRTTLEIREPIANQFIDYVPNLYS